MKVVINRCYGGFGISPSAVKRMAELNGRECHFFEMAARSNGKYAYLTLEQAEAAHGWWVAFDTEKPPEQPKNWYELSQVEREAFNAEYERHSLPSGRELDRSDPILLQVIDELGEKANGAYAKLAVVEIPDGTDYTIEEYDGNEHVAEVHRTWY